MSETGNSFGFYVGQEVVTRRGKFGFVTAVGVDTVDVKFGGKVFTMKNGQVISARGYRKMNARAAAKGHGNQYLDR